MFQVQVSFSFALLLALATTFPSLPHALLALLQALWGFVDVGLFFQKLWKLLQHLIAYTSANDYHLLPTPPHNLHFNPVHSKTCLFVDVYCIILYYLWCRFLWDGWQILIISSATVIVLPRQSSTSQAKVQVRHLPISQTEHSWRTFWS